MAKSQGYKIFLSHTRKDKDFCDFIDKAFARPPIGSFRSELESVQPPAWQDIKTEIESSVALFLLIGRKLAASQASRRNPNWKYTQNWIACEIGMACKQGIDVWVLCDDGVEINYPVPYFNNYVPFGLRQEPKLEFLKAVLKHYIKGGRVTPLYLPQRKVNCPHSSCRIEFNLHTPLDSGTKIKCPCCLNYIPFPKGFPPS